MPRVVHFEINADQPERAIKFYSDVFGWNIQRWGGSMEYWLATTGEEGEPGIDGAITRRRESAITTVNTINVPSVDDFTKKVTENGGSVTMPKTAIPGVGYFAYCLDTEGNTFGIMEEDQSAS